MKQQRRLFRLPGALTLCMGLLLAAPQMSLAQADADNEAERETEQGPNLEMTATRLSELILNVDDEAQHDGSTWLFHVAGLEVGVVYDIRADRMRIVIPIGPAEELTKDEILRLMQANYDSALDARYAIANDQLWGVYIHPLSELSDQEFLVALGETANVVLSYGTSYSSGLFIFRGGDSAQIQRRELIDELKKKTI